ncbi:MAG: methyl-accepting chemotaxis protein [Symbiobacteriaceae bacterium]|nr:methyl-accepting chemotaxis protein [Symbiobacteriaceae bacterium]
MSRLSFQWRTVLLTLLILLVGFAVMIVFVGVTSYSTLAKTSEARLQAITYQLANTCDAAITEALASIITATPNLEYEIAANSATREGWTDALIRQMEHATSLDALYLYFEANAFDGLDARYRNVDYHDASGIYAPLVRIKNGIAVVTTSNTDKHRMYPYFNKVYSATSEIITQPYIDTDTREWVITGAVQIWSPTRQMIGFMAADYRLQALNTYLADFHIFDSNEGIILLCAADGTVAASSRDDYLGKNFFTSLATNELTTDIKSSLTSSTPVFGEGYVASLHGNAMFSAVPFYIGRTGEVLFAVSIIPTAIANVEDNIILRILITLGVITLLVAVAVLFFSVRSATRTITASKENLLEAATAVLSSSTQISGSSEFLANGGVQQAASIEETSATMSQASVSIQANASNTRQALRLSEDASRAAEKGYTRVSELITSMEELSSSSDEIGRIIKIIDDIAFQTNILALNAAVEAARAGDDGLGFAVVAAEVGSLANKSADAAKETASIIEHNLDLSRRGVDSSIEVGAALSNISTKNSEVFALMQQIGTSSEEQARAAAQINIALSQMEDVTQSNAAVAEESSAAANELMRQAKVLEELTRELDQLVSGGSGNVNLTTATDNQRDLPTTTGTRRDLPAAPSTRRNLPTAPPRNLPAPRTPPSATSGRPATPLPQRQPHIVSPNDVIPLEKNNPF